MATKTAKRPSRPGAAAREPAANVPRSSPVDVAKAELGRLVDLERGWARERLAKTTEVSAASAGSGRSVVDAALAGDGTTERAHQASSIAELEDQLEQLDRTLDVARIRHGEALVATWRAEADELDTAAERLEAEAADRAELARRKLDELSAIEGVTFVAAEPVMMRSSGGQVGGALTVVNVQRPRSARLREEAVGMRRRASLLRQRTIEGDANEAANRASISGLVGLEAVVEALYRDPAKVAPRLAPVLAWAIAAEKAELARRSARIRTFGEEDARLSGLGEPVVFTVTWNGAELVLAACSAGRPEA